MNDVSSIVNISRSEDSPATLIGKAITKASHVVTNGYPFGTTDDTNVLDG